MRYVLAVLILSVAAFAADTTVIVKAVNMETGAYSTNQGGHTFTWHSMEAEIDGTRYKIGNIYRPFHREEWLHKGTYTGRWKNSGHTKLEVDENDSGKIRHLEFKVLGEE